MLLRILADPQFATVRENQFLQEPYGRSGFSPDHPTSAKMVARATTKMNLFPMLH